MVLEQTPPELLKDVADNGVVLTGGGALLRNLDVLLSQEIGVTAKISEDPLSAVVRGAGRIVEDPSLLERLSLRLIRRSSPAATWLLFARFCPPTWRMASDHRTALNGDRGGIEFLSCRLFFSASETLLKSRWGIC